MLKWMKQYLIEEKNYLNTDTLTMSGFVEGDKIILGYGNHHRPHARIWAQLEKQFELLTTYFGIQLHTTYSNRYRYWKPCLSLNNLDQFQNFADIQVKDRYATIKIHNAQQFITAYNKLLSDYLYWCADHRKHCENGLILPTDYYGSYGIDWELTTDRQKEIDRKKQELAYQKRVEEENRKNAEIRQQLIDLYNEGKLITTCSVRYVYDDSSWYSISVNVNNLYEGHWQLHAGNSLYTSFTNKIPAFFSQEVFESILLTFYTRWKQARKPKDGFHDNGSLKLMDHSRLNPMKIKIKDTHVLLENLQHISKG